MAQQDGSRVHVASQGQHLARKAAPTAIAGAFDSCPLEQGRHVTLQGVAGFVIAPLAARRSPLASLQRAPLGIDPNRSLKHDS